MKEIRQSIAALQLAARARPAGYLEALLKLGRVEGEFMVFSRENYLAAVREFSPQSYAQTAAQVEKMLLPESAPYPQWPLWAKMLAHLAVEGDRGLGDVVARKVGPVGGDAFKRWAQSVGFSCGCDDRQAWLNAKYPLPG